MVGGASKHEESLTPCQECHDASQKELALQEELAHVFHLSLMLEDAPPAVEEKAG